MSDLIMSDLQIAASSGFGEIWGDLEPINSPKSSQIPRTCCYEIMSTLTSDI